jgi:hypothetical protein
MIVMECNMHTTDMRGQRANAEQGSGGAGAAKRLDRCKVHACTVH